MIHVREMTAASAHFDMIKFGDPGKKKKPCVLRKCTDLKVYTIGITYTCWLKLSI